MLVRLMTLAKRRNLIGLRRGSKGLSSQLKGEELHLKQPSQHLDFTRAVTFQLGGRARISVNGILTRSL
jgi:hypothetical protein